jgi:hypothetical protein
MDFDELILYHNEGENLDFKLEFYKDHKKVELIKDVLAFALDDLETFLLTCIAQKKRPEDFVNFLLMRENLHNHLICSDELEICGGFISGKLTQAMADSDKVMVTSPDLGNLFDEQYRKGMGFKNEKFLAEQKSGKYLFW